MTGRNIYLYASQGMEAYLQKQFIGCTDLEGIDPEGEEVEAIRKVLNDAELHTTDDGATLRIWKDYQWWFDHENSGCEYLQNKLSHGYFERFLFILIDPDPDYDVVLGYLGKNPFGLELEIVRNVTFTMPTENTICVHTVSNKQ